MAKNSKQDYYPSIVSSGNLDILACYDLYKSLMCAIVLQAVNDYKELKTKKISSLYVNHQKCSLSEITSFLNGNWCKFLLQHSNIYISGSAIIEKLNDFQY